MRTPQRLVGFIKTAATTTPAASPRRWLSATSVPLSPMRARQADVEPLRILFCGSDDFSCTSLRALHAEMQRQQGSLSDEQASLVGRIASLDVVVRPAKRTGRGLKQIHDSPVKVTAAGLGLCVHERDTFTGWQPPPVNMVIAVSFGLFVPPRILGAARYGGLNVHPSLLPDLRGAAPIEHAILAGRLHTGVTVQTLDGRAFDEGRILLQGPPADAGAPGLAIPRRCTADELRRLLAPLGSELLVRTLRQGLYLPGATADAARAEDPAATGPVPILAPKLSKADQQVPWRQLQHCQAPTTADDIGRRARALGPLWTHMLVPEDRRRRTSTTSPPPIPHTIEKRAILGDIDLVACPDGMLPLLLKLAEEGGQAETKHLPCPLQTVTLVQRDSSASSASSASSTAVTLPFAVSADGSGSVILPVAVSTDGSSSSLCLRIGTIKIEGDRVKPAALVVSGASSKGTPLGQVAWDVVLHK